METKESKKPLGYEDKLKDIQKGLPGMKKILQEQRRLLDLAKSSPEAAANSDFLEMCEMRLAAKENETALMQTILDVVCDKEKPTVEA